MRIFSNFDTNLNDRLYQEAVERFGEDKVLFVRRDKIYLILKIWLRLWIWLLICGLFLILFYTYVWMWSPIGRFFWWLLRLIIIITWLILIYLVIKKLIDYYMDYTIVTPLNITQYDQTWILQRTTRSLDIFKIKTISIDKRWLLRSIFNYWSIVFFTEWDSSQQWDITLNYISNPNLLRDSIQNIIDVSESISRNLNPRTSV